MFHTPEKYRITVGDMATTAANGCNGAFLFPSHDGRIVMIATDHGGWEHLSISHSKRCPTWEEMCLAKKLFWDDEDCVIQYHPPASEYVNRHPYCLHLWRPVGITLPLPPKEFV